MRHISCTGLACAVLLMAPSMSAADETAAGASTLAQMACEAAPDPVAALLPLLAEKRLVQSEALRADSSTCWPLDPPIADGEMRFSHLCAAAEDPALIAQHPDLFWRGPGSSPGTELTLVTSAGEDALAAWALAAFPDGSPAYNIVQSYRIEGATEIACNSLTFTF